VFVDTDMDPQVTAEYAIWFEQTGTASYVSIGRWGGAGYLVQDVPVPFQTGIGSLVVAVPGAYLGAPAGSVRFWATTRYLPATTSGPFDERVPDAGAYTVERMKDLPRHLVLKYFEKCPGPPDGPMRVTASLRRMVEFRRQNLIERPFPGQPFDFIFCRNAMIYFDREVQQRVIRRLEERLAPGGYLFTSHSESLNNLRHGLTWIAPSIYRLDAR